MVPNNIKKSFFWDDDPVSRAGENDVQPYQMLKSVELESPTDIYSQDTIGFLNSNKELSYVPISSLLLKDPNLIPALRGEITGSTDGSTTTTHRLQGDIFTRPIQFAPPSNVSLCKDWCVPMKTLALITLAYYIRARFTSDYKQDANRKLSSFLSQKESTSSFFLQLLGSLFSLENGPIMLRSSAEALKLIFEPVALYAVLNPDDKDIINEALEKIFSTGAWIPLIKDENNPIISYLTDPDPENDLSIQSYSRLQTIEWEKREASIPKCETRIEFILRMFERYSSKFATESALSRIVKNTLNENHSGTICDAAYEYCTNKKSVATIKLPEGISLGIPNTNIEWLNRSVEKNLLKIDNQTPSWISDSADSALDAVILSRIMSSPRERFGPLLDMQRQALHDIQTEKISIDNIQQVTRAYIRSWLLGQNMDDLSKWETVTDEEMQERRELCYEALELFVEEALVSEYTTK